MKFKKMKSFFKLFFENKFYELKYLFNIKKSWQQWMAAIMIVLFSYLIFVCIFDISIRLVNIIVATLGIGCFILINIIIALKQLKAKVLFHK